MLSVVNDRLSLQSETQNTMHSKEVHKFSLTNGFATIGITNLGCTILEIYTPDKNGRQQNIVAGFKDINDYQNNRDYFGCVVGRYANRIGGGSFPLNGKKIILSVNDGKNHLHGGVDGFHKKVWDIKSLIQEDDKVGVVFEYLSKDGEEGYPGNLKATVKYILNSENNLNIEYHAETDKATPVNLTNHSYFNLTGFDKPVIDEHVLQINAAEYTENDEYSLPTGTISKVAGTVLDFAKPKKIGSDINSFPFDRGYNHNFILPFHDPEELILAATLSDPLSGRTLTVYTDRPAIQLYTANFWDASILGSQGQYYQMHGGVALETQAFPDSPNQPSFPNSILDPGNHFFSTTIYEFGVQ